jgi:hypothetical protein
MVFVRRDGESVCCVDGGERPWALGYAVVAVTATLFAKLLSAGWVAP